MSFRVSIIVSAVVYAGGMIFGVARIVQIARGEETWNLGFGFFLLALTAAPVLIISTALMRRAQIRYRTRQHEAVARLSPGAVIFGAYESPVVMTQLNYLRATTVPPLPPLERERRPLAVSVSAGEIAVWRGNSPPGRVVSLPTSILRGAQLFGGHTNAAQVTVLLDILWEDQVVGFNVLLFEGHIGGSPAQQARKAELQQELQQFVSIAP